MKDELLYRDDRARGEAPADVALREVFAWRDRLEWTDDAITIDGRSFPIRNRVLRFREDDGYNASFALQWNRFKSNQIDTVNGTDLSMRRFAETGWRRPQLRGKRVLEAGCGAGRFTRILAESGAQVYSFDYSAAVDANVENNGRFSNVTFLQCDIFDMPFRDQIFDYVFCHGVLQHTPDPQRAFDQLDRKLRPGGSISVDVYCKDGLIRPWKSKYLWRPLTTRVAPEMLLKFLEWFIPRWLPFDTFIKRIPRLGNYLGAFVPCWNYYRTDLSPEQQLSWAIMDTFDALAPAFDNPVSLDEVNRWFRDRDYESASVHPGGNGVVGNGVKRLP